MNTQMGTKQVGEHWLVIGGSGFIGRELCRQLLDANQQVIVLTRDIARASGLLPRSIKVVDRLEPDAQVDIVVNLAGENLASHRWTAARKKLLVSSRVNTTQALNRWVAALENPPRVVVSGSAVGWYGPCGDEPLDEDAQPGVDFASNLCRAWEAEADNAQSPKTRVVRLRTGVVLGRNGGALQKMMRVFNLGLGGRTGSGRQWISWIHLEDIARLIIWLASSKTARGAYNGTAPRPVTNAEFARTLALAMRRPSALTTPSALLRILLGEMASILTTGQRVLPKRAIQGGFTFRYPTLAGAIRAEITRSAVHS